MVITPFSRATLLLFTALILLAPLPAAWAQERTAKIDEVLSLAHRYGQFNGAALVAEGGRVIYKKGFGMANMEWAVPNAPDTRFRIGSITKQFTAVLVLQLVERGKLRLDGRLTDYLPEYRPDTGRKVTVHHLLTHTSGIPNYTNQPGFLENVSRNPYKVDEFVRKYASGDFEFEPGTKFSYSNSGYFLLGAIIERVTGKPYEQVLKENILDPAGMRDTGYDRHDRVIPKRASGYHKTPDGYANAPYFDMSNAYAAGSMYSTVEDLYLWDQALYTDKLLSDGSKELMFKPYLNGYAYGWGVIQRAFGPGGPPVQAVAHAGGINGFNTVIKRFVGQKHLIVLLDNTQQEQGVARLSDAIGRILYDQPYERPKKSLADALLKTISQKGLEAGVAQYRELKAGRAGEYDFGEQELNVLGYRLLQSGKVREAVEFFKLNAEAYPQSSNAYDSLGEGYMVSGERELAARNYRRSLELNTKNDNAVEMLRRLEGATAAADPKVFDAYVGEYELGPGFNVSVFREGDRLMTQTTGGPKSEIFPVSETTFSSRASGAKLTFVKDATGRVTGVRIQQGGREDVGRKIK